MNDDYEWMPRTVLTYPLFMQDIQREITVELILEQAHCDFGVLQIEYSRSPESNRAFTSAMVSASIWEFDDDEGTYELLKSRHGFQNIGLAKRWAAAIAEIYLVVDANNWIQYAGETPPVVDDDDDPFGFFGDM
jgi:hypothetical protein